LSKQEGLILTLVLALNLSGHKVGQVLEYTGTFRRNKTGLISQDITLECIQTTYDAGISSDGKE